MDYAEAKALVFNLLKEDEPLSEELKAFKDSDDEKFSDYLDSMDFLVLDYELLKNFPQYQLREPFTKENTLRDVCNFIAANPPKKPLE
ncbi:MAG TPA: hypothetical protein DD619_05095 [Alphaproteobacteria bacterium]|nr:hypothetical protein [Alphaproteobacteria bacterium]